MAGQTLTSTLWLAFLFKNWHNRILGGFVLMMTIMAGQTLTSILWSIHKTRSWIGMTGVLILKGGEFHIG